jgi:hypothetical protein
MKILAFLGVLFACGLSLQTAASADTIIDQYCLEFAEGGGGATVNCAFETMAQCLASKGSPGDRCFANPRLNGRRQ